MSGDTVNGFATEFSCVEANSLTRMPSNYTFEEAATLPGAALTALRALIVKGNLKAGQSVLVQGTGGMSLFALKIAKALRAYVYATSSSEEKMARLKELGADEGSTTAQMKSGGKLSANALVALTTFWTWGLTPHSSNPSLPPPLAGTSHYRDFETAVRRA